MAAKFVDLRRYGSNMALEKDQITKAADRVGLEALDVARDGVMLHGEPLMIAAFLDRFPEPPDLGDGDLEDDL